MREALKVALHPNLVQGLFYPAAYVRFRVTHGQGPEGHVLETGGGKELVVGVLEYQTDLRPDERQVGAVHREASHQDRALAAQDPVEMKHERAFSSPVRPYQGDP